MDGNNIKQLEHLPCQYTQTIPCSSLQDCPSPFRLLGTGPFCPSKFKNVLCPYFHMLISPFSVNLFLLLSCSNNCFIVVLLSNVRSLNFASNFYCLITSFAAAPFYVFLLVSCLSSVVLLCLTLSVQVFSCKFSSRQRDIQRFRCDCPARKTLPQTCDIKNIPQWFQQVSLVPTSNFSVSYFPL